MSVTDQPWLYEKRSDGAYNTTTKYGKFVLWFDNIYMDLTWSYAKKIFRKGYLDEIDYMKSSTKFAYPNSSYEDEGSIMLYCSDYNNDDNIKIRMLGEKIINLFDYRHKNNIQFKINVRENPRTFLEHTSKTITIQNSIFDKYCKYCDNMLMSESNFYWRECNNCLEKNINQMKVQE